MKMMSGEEVESNKDDGFSDTKTMRSRREVIQLYEAYNYLLQQDSLTIDVIKKCHSILMEKIADEEKEYHGGEFRTNPCYGDDWVFPDHKNIPSLMEGFESEAKKLLPQCSRENMIIIAAHLSSAFVSIHPFTDGNGRVSRLILNYVLKKGGFPFPISLQLNKSKPRKAYYNAMEQFFRDGRSVQFPVLILSSMHHTITNANRYGQKKVPVLKMDLNKALENSLVSIE